MWRRAVVRWMLLAVVVGVSGPPLPARADQAPFWESPVGLVPGHPTMQVRMASESVDVQVVERGEEVHAVVVAAFTMVNDGPDVDLKVGFPAITTSLFDELAEPDADGRRLADAPGLFSPQAIRAFQVSVDGRELRSWQQQVPAADQAGFGADWLMWEMSFPAGRTVRVDVTYEQVLSSRSDDPFVQPMYVLRTGALWHGPIGEATVTLSAPDGGVFLGGPELYSRAEPDGTVSTYPRVSQVYGPADAAESSPTRLVWRLRDVEPTRDVGATYVRSDVWREYANAERAIVEGTPTAEQLRRAAHTALRILGPPTLCGPVEDLPCLAGPHRVPRGLVDRLAPAARERARRAVQLAPDDAATQLTYGDVEWWFAMPARKHLGELGCWPSNAADAYQRAQEHGAPEAERRLDALREAARHVRRFQDARIDTCSGEPDQRLDVELLRATVEEGNGVWSRAVARFGRPEGFPAYFADRWLDERVAEVEDLRRTRRYRDAKLGEIQFTSVALVDANTGTVETIEVWQDRTYNEDGSVTRDASGQLRQRYDLRKIDGQWRIVGAEIVRE